MNLIFAFAAGIVASFINIFAGGGSLITLPFLMFLGLPAPVASGTNKVGLLAGTLSSTVNFHRKKVLHWKELILVAPCGIAGAVIGSFFAIDIPDKVYKIMLSVVMVLVLAMILLRPQRFIREKRERSEREKKILLSVLFLLVGFYGGFIQAGMGYMAILTLTLAGEKNLLKISGYKASMGLVIVLFSLVIFIVKGMVHWPLALALAAGNAVGGWLGSHLASEKGDKIIRPILAIAVILMALKLSGALEFFSGLIFITG